MSEFYKRYRPKTLEQVIGQEMAIQQLQGFVSTKTIPHCLLLTGPSGTGKTSIVRILVEKHLKVRGKDYREVNCASARGIDDIRDIDNKMSAYGMHGRRRAFALDEAHQLTKEAQSALLKMTEDTLDHVWFFLLTTNPQKILKTLITRSTPIDLQAIQAKDLERLILSICRKEKAGVSQEVADKLVECSDGSARMALVHLQRILHLKKDKDRIALLSARSDAEKEGIDLIRHLINGMDFSGAMKLLKAIESPDVEEIRRGALGYAAVTLLNGVRGTKQKICLRVIRAMRDNFFDSGRAGLVAAVWEIFEGSLP